MLCAETELSKKAATHRIVYLGLPPWQDPEDPMRGPVLQLGYRYKGPRLSLAGLGKEISRCRLSRALRVLHVSSRPRSCVKPIWGLG